VQNAQREIESRRSMIDETVQAIRNGNIEITKDELRAISKATANLRNALDAQPDETAGREIVLLAQKMILAALESVNERDTSWH
jgi:hypothetical protein